MATVDQSTLETVEQAIPKPSTRCAHCDDEVVWVTPQIAELVVQAPAVRVDRMIDRDELHLRRTHDDLLVICLNSLHEARRTMESPLPSATGMA